MTIPRSRVRESERIQFAREQRQSATEFSRDVWELVRALAITR
ncbi:hypothetical protein [Allorhodopirellula heiligendammensis]|nr:hypothetical protein [Allorhodopirellula heiligendammensis]